MTTSDTSDWFARQTVRPDQVAHEARPKTIRLTGQVPVGFPELDWIVEGDEYPVQGWVTPSRPVVNGVALHECEWVAP